MLSLLVASALAADPALTGTWVPDASAEALQSLHAQALDKGLENLPWALRPVARPFLKGTVRSCARLDLSLESTAFRAKCDDRPGLEIDLSGDPVPTTGEDGGACEIRPAQVDSGVKISFHCERGGQHNTYVRDGDGLLVTREVFSPQLAAPITWTVRYKPS